MNISKLSHQVLPEGIDVRHWGGGSRWWRHNLHRVAAGGSFGGPCTGPFFGTLLSLAFLVLLLLLVFLGCLPSLAFGGGGVFCLVRGHRFLLLWLQFLGVRSTNVSVKEWVQKINEVKP